MEELVQKIELVITRENKKLKEELRKEFKQENKNSKNELKTELKSELTTELTDALSKSFKKQVLDWMFVFEENYGRKIDIMYDGFKLLLEKNERIKSENATLEKRVDKNTSYIYNHEKRIATL